MRRFCFFEEKQMIVNENSVKAILNEVGSEHLVAATKYVDTNELVKLEALGVKYFGENRVQALLEKYEQYHGTSKFHFIGTLQSNKVKYIIDKVELIHSVDSLSLAKEINKQAKKHDLIMPVLLQVNISNEETKHGFDKEEVIDAINYLIENCPHVALKGFMTMAPNMEPSQTEVFFAGMETLLHEMQEQYPQLQLTELSMGMSNDYEYALKHSATLIRVGSKLFNK